MRAYTHTYTRKHTQTYTRAHKHTYANIHKHKHKHTHANTHTHIHTVHIHTNQLTYTHSHTCVHTPTQTHTQCSFVIGGPSLWNHFPDNVKEARFIELFKEILKTLVFSQSFEIQAFSSFCNSTLEFIRFIYSKKMVLNVQPHRTTLLCLHVQYNMWNAVRSRKIPV